MANTLTKTWLEQITPITSNSRLPLSEQVYESLLQAILSGVIGPEQHLVEQPLADQLGVSRISIREAIRRLAEDGLVEIIPNRGAFTLRFTTWDIEEIFSLRAILEGLGIRIATETARKSDIARLEEIVEDMKTIEKSDDRLIGASYDTKFHRALINISGHTRVIRAWESMSAQITMVVYNSTTYYPNIAGLAQRHQAVIDVILEGDQAQAEAHIQAHILEGGAHLLKALGRDGLVAYNDKNPNLTGS